MRFGIEMRVFERDERRRRAAERERRSFGVVFRRLVEGASPSQLPAGETLGAGKPHRNRSGKCATDARLSNV